MSKVYQVISSPQPTAAGAVTRATGTTVKTLLQIATPSTEDMKIVEWGISFDGSTSATPVLVELIDTNVAATVTAYVAADVIKLNAPNDAASLITLGTTASGYNASAEGTITAARSLDTQLIAPSSSYFKQYPLGREPAVAVSRFLRVRVTAPATVNAVAYVTWEE